MKKLKLTLTITAFFGLVASFTYSASLNAQQKVVGGNCNTNAPDNKGIITIRCTGFSEKQNKQILGFIKQLSNDQAKDQETLLAKLDEVLAAIKASKNQSQRIISDEAQQQMHASLDQFRGQIVQIAAPSGNTESSNLAVRIKEILGGMGWQVLPVKYGPEPPPPETGSDFMIRASGAQTTQAAPILGEMLMQFANLKTANIIWSNDNQVQDPRFKLPPIFKSHGVVTLYIYPNPTESLSIQKTQ